MTNKDYKLKVLVCGGRDYDNIVLAYFTLNTLLKKAKPEDILIIQGGAKGADKLAKDWANQIGADCLEFPADWGTHGKSAGFIRNSQMLEEGKPTGVIAFKGGPGTRMMCELAEKKNVPVKRVGWT
jgi:hypothetical protein